MGLFESHAATREDPAMREQVAQLQAEMPYYAGNPGLTAAQAAAEARAGRNNH